MVKMHSEQEKTGFGFEGIARPRQLADGSWDAPQSLEAHGNTYKSGKTKFDAPVTPEQIAEARRPYDDAESDNNGNMSEAQYEAFVKQSWEKAVNHQEGEPIEKKEFTIQEDKNRRHLTDSQRIRHIYKTHGKEKTERNCGNIAITEKDVSKLQAIIAKADYIIKNILYDNKKTIIYAKHNEAGTYIYIERPSNRKHGNITETFYNLYKQKDEDMFLRILANNNRYSNIENAEIIIGSGGGGNPSGQGDHYAVPAVAKSAHPADTSLSPKNTDKSSDNPMGAKDAIPAYLRAWGGRKMTV
jgi:hypothetical protein